MNSKLSQWCNGFIEMGWIAAVIAIPLFFNIHSDRVFEPDKLTLLRSIALLMSVAWIVKFINEQAWQDLDWLRWKNEASIWQQPFILPVFLLVVVYLLSTLFSITPRVSWAGSYQRLQGTYTTLSYIAVFALVAATMRTRAQVNRVITAVIITSIPISFYGMLQHFDLDPLPWGGNTITRIAGHMGNAIFIAAYLIMAVPPTLARIVDAFTNILGDDELSYADVIRASIYIFTLAIQLLAIYWSSSRGPWLGLGIGLFAFILILLVSLRNADPTHKRIGLGDIGKVLALLFGGIIISFFVFDFIINQVTATGRLESLAGPMASFIAFAASVGMVTLIIFIMVAIRRGWRWLWLSWMLLALVLALWLGAFNFADSISEQFGETPLIANISDTLLEWKNLPSIGRLGQLIDSESRTGTVRVYIWTGVLDLIGIHEPLKYPDGHEDPFNFLRPLIGYGPESMYVAYNRFYPPELATVEARNASPDRSHNETFDALVITGGLGFLIWQALYISVFYYGFKWLGVVRGKRDRNLLLALWILGAVVATAVIVPTMGAPFFGVAVPFGSIIGLVLYLIYYALFAYSDSDEVLEDPFAVDRLLMIALVTAVLAHYVEIHFGIAIAATRLHFFTYVGLLFIIGYLLPRLQEAPAVVESKTRKRRRVSRTLEPFSKDAWGPILLHGLMLVLMIGIMGFEYTTYSLPPDKVIESPADITAGEIFHQSLFLNARKDFADSPFIFLMIMLTWT
ncbi:MAG: O-antigen ligase family protein, partial [Anaerolineales bacterium]|nr:O-antigen ligase family protein [Anaerolineales bacterium]